MGNREVGTEAGCLAYEGVFNPGSTVYTYTSFHYSSLDACMVHMLLLLLCLLVCREGIDWADIEWVDNAECLDLIERV